VSHIEVLPHSQRDDALRMKVYRAIFQDSGAGEGPYSSTLLHIIVKNGYVTLEGVVTSEADRSAVYLKAVHAATHVTDNLRVRADTR
jgi:hypothetical protein